MASNFNLAEVAASQPLGLFKVTSHLPDPVQDNIRFFNQAPVEQVSVKLFLGMKVEVIEDFESRGPVGQISQPSAYPGRDS